MTSKVKQLEKRYGGNWKYCPVTFRWLCDDGRYVAKVHTGGFDVSGEPMPGFDYFLYEKNKGKRIYFPAKAITKKQVDALAVYLKMMRRT